MPQYTGGAAGAAARVRALRASIIQAVIDAETANIEDAKAALIAASSGTLSTSELRAMGHPFARRAPQNPPDPSVVNDQGGPFKGDWRIDGPHDFGTETSDSVLVRSTCLNIDPKAVFMLGTKTMVQRRIVQRVIEIIRERRRQRVQSEIARTLAKSSH